MILCAGDFDSSKLDVFLSHDWPSGIWQFGDCERLMQTKPFLRYDSNHISRGYCNNFYYNYGCCPVAVAVVKGGYYKWQAR